jgi:hypothetical protein
MVRESEFEHQWRKVALSALEDPAVFSNERVVNNWPAIKVVRYKPSKVCNGAVAAGRDCL